MDLRYGEVLSSTSASASASSATTPVAPTQGSAWAQTQIERPQGDCLTRAELFVRHKSHVLTHEEADRFRGPYQELLAGLPSPAQQTLSHTRGVWFAQEIPGAAARFIPCKTEDDEVTGLILVDVTAYPLDGTARDVDVPSMYWSLLGEAGQGVVRPIVPPPPSDDPAARYVLLHEIGHALSLLAGEFDLTEDHRFTTNSGAGFMSKSWAPLVADVALVTDVPLATAQRPDWGFSPSRLALNDWMEVRQALDAEPTFLAPGYKTPSKLSSPVSRCATIKRLPRAGFVTPAAALSPPEDYAEVFAHALLAAEGKISPTDEVEITLPGCPSKTMKAPYFSSGLAHKRAYMERALGLSTP